MSESKRLSLRSAINKKCRSCVFDKANAGSWLTQVTLCSCKSCPLYEVRPVTKSPISKGTLQAYGVSGVEFEFYRQSDPQEGYLTEETPIAEPPAERGFMSADSESALDRQSMEAAQ
jgi:hypothetical protein